MPNLLDSDLRDPSPPVPGAAQRAAVATRAHQLGRKRRIMQGAGALGMVAVVAVGVAALTAGGSGSGTSRIEAANADGTTAPAPAPTGNDATSAPVAASTFTVSGTVNNIPADTTLTLTLTGTGGTFTAIADRAGNYSIDAVPAGEYEASVEWSSTDLTAASVARLGVVTISGDSTFGFDLE